MCYRRLKQCLVSLVLFSLLSFSPLCFSCYAEIKLTDEEAQQMLSEIQESKKDLKELQEKLLSAEAQLNDVKNTYNEQKTSYEMQLNEAEKKILESKMSPDALCGEARLSGRFQKIVSTKTLYNYIDKRILKVRNIDLPLKAKRKSHADKRKQNKRLFGTSIEERSDEVNNRTVFGHWEIDTVVGKKESSSVLLSLDERLTRKRHLVKIPSRSSDAVRLGLEKVAKLYGENFENVFKSVTSDNGSEFVDLGRYLPKSTKVYYAHPYSSYERGTNEKQNSLVRRFFPKGKSFDNITDEQVAFVENWINNLPRKIFNYHCSDFIFKNVLFDIAI